MTKLKWNRVNQGSILNSDYYTNPKKGFDQKWHNQRNTLRQNLGIHEAHNWEIINKPIGPHAGKVICKTCGNKFISWLPKNYISSNT